MLSAVTSSNMIKSPKAKVFQSRKIKDQGIPDGCISLQFHVRNFKTGFVNSAVKYCSSKRWSLLDL